jgi:hypothetical protein
MGEAGVLRRVDGHAGRFSWSVLVPIIADEAGRAGRFVGRRAEVEKRISPLRDSR